LVQALDEYAQQVFILAHERTGEISESDERKRVIASMRTVGTALLEELPSVMDLVLRLETTAFLDPTTQKVVNQVRMRSRNHGFYIAGDRTGMFKDQWPVDPEKFWSRVLEYLKLAGQAKLEGEKA
jgi:hypothetical protein